MAVKTLRDYQRRAIEQGIYGYFEENKGNPLIVLPTGTGKSLVIAEFIREVMEIWPDQRIIVLAHVKELIEQNYRELMEQAPDLDAGIYSAGLKRRDTDTKVLFAGIQSVYKRAYELGMFDLALIDEAHTVPHEGEGQYRTFLKDARRANPSLKSIGFTATPFRLSQGLLTEGEGALFSDISYDGTEELLDMIAQGYLCPVRTKGVKTKYDLSGLHVRGGEYVASELEAAMDVDDLTEAALKEVIQHGEDRKAWLIFASSVAHAWHIKESLVLKGITAAVVTGETAQEDRDAIIRAYKAGEIRAIVNMGVLTTGFNHPSIDLLVLLRKTKSTGLYVQMIGRGMRVADGKSDCLVLDFGENIQEHGPIDTIRPRSKAKSDNGGTAPVRECPGCATVLHISITICPECGHVFPLPEPKIVERASSAPILSSQIPILIETFPIDNVSYSRHEKPGKTPSLRIDYFTGYKRVASEWICLEHVGYAREKAEKIWFERTGRAAPDTVDEGLEQAPLYMKEPTEITVNLSGDFPRITNFTYSLEVPAVGWRHDSRSTAKARDFDDDVPF